MPSPEREPHSRWSKPPKGTDGLTDDQMEQARSLLFTHEHLVDARTVKAVARLIAERDEANGALEFAERPDSQPRGYPVDANQALDSSHGSGDDSGGDSGDESDLAWTREPDKQQESPPRSSAPPQRSERIKGGAR